jgi:hypothetical protein
MNEPTWYFEKRTSVSLFANPITVHPDASIVCHLCADPELVVVDKEV